MENDKIKKANVMHHYNRLFEKHPELDALKETIYEAYDTIKQSYDSGKKVLACGNGGSAADADHIVGELMKGFYSKRPLPQDVKFDGLESDLQGSLPAISLTQHVALSTAFANDVNPDMVFAQQVYGYGAQGDVIICISTSGNAKNVVNAAKVAKGKKLMVVSLTGRTGGKLKELSDVCINVPCDITADVQEYHLPIYHTLCAMIEDTYF